jgi:chromosome segregation ATPase
LVLGERNKSILIKLGILVRIKEELDRELDLRSDYDHKFDTIRQAYDDKIRNLENEIVELNLQFLGEQKKSSALVQKEVDLSRQIISAKNDEIDELTAQVASLTHSLDQSSAEVARLKASICESEATMQEFQATTTNRHLEYFKQMEAKIAKLTEQLQASEAEFACKAADLEGECSRKVADLQACNVKLGEELKASRSLLETFKAQAEEIEANWRSNLEVKEEIIVGLSAERDGLNADVERLETEFRRVCEKREELGGQVERLGEEMNERVRKATDEGEEKLA